jgi:periplasmic divalent cation tolerance protein
MQGTGKSSVSERTDAICVSLCSVPDAACALRIANDLVQSRLAACVQMLPPMQSVYEWNGVLQQETELLLLIKHRQTGFAALAQRIRSLHPWAVPEILALPALEVEAHYADWVRAQCVD